MAQISSNRQVQSIGIRSLQFVIHAEVNGIGSGITVQTAGEILWKSAAAGAQGVEPPARKVRRRNVGVTSKTRDARRDSRGLEAASIGEHRRHTERTRPVERGQQRRPNPVVDHSKTSANRRLVSFSEQ